MFLDNSRKVQEKKLTYLSTAKFNSMASCMQAIKNDAVLGDFLEFGVALGGSGICIASELDGTRRFAGFDLFGMIPPPGDKDGPIPQGRFDVIKSGKSEGIGGDKYYGYISNLRDVVIGNFMQFGLRVDGEKIALVQGLFEDTLPHQPERTIAFAHLDCDWYDPVMYCLNYVTPRLSPGGFIILDDYNDWPGCKKAADEFVAAHPDLEVKRAQPHAVLYKRPV